MNKFLGVGALAALIGALVFVSRRLATHQKVLPGVTSHVNTRVIRINQR